MGEKSTFLGATARQLAPERIYKPPQGLNDISVWSKSRYGRSLSRNRAVNLANAGLEQCQRRCALARR